MMEVEAIVSWETYFASDDFKSLAISIGILLLFLLVRKIFIKYIYKAILKLSRKSSIELLTQLFLAFERPLQWLFVIIGVYVAVDYFPYLEQKNILFEHFIRTGIIVIITWGLYNLTSSASVLFNRLNKHANMQLDDILIPFISKGVRVIIIAISLSVIAQEFEYDVNGFIAGLGLGGLAFALAAQDAISNLFGGFIIITERPFTIDDWISSPSVEGIIEDITFRSTLVRTFDEALVTVPNSTLASEAITNWSEMGKRGINFDLRVTYDAPITKIREVVQKIETLLKEHDRVHQETVFVKLNNLQDSGADIMLYFFTKTTEWEKHLDVREDINFKIMEILDETDVSIAIPLRRLFSHNKKDYETHAQPE